MLISTEEGEMKGEVYEAAKNAAEEELRRSYQFPRIVSDFEWKWIFLSGLRLIDRLEQK
jgi:hypothetical protein